MGMHVWNPSPVQACFEQAATDSLFRNSAAGCRTEITKAPRHFFGTSLAPSWANLRKW